MRSFNLKTGIAAAVASAVVLSSFSAYAAKVYLNESDRDITIIEGTSNLTENGKITLSVFKKGSDYTTLDGSGASEFDTLPYVTVVNTDADGKWRAEWKNLHMGYYDIYASDGVGIADKTDTAVFVTSGMKGKYECLANGTRDELETMFADRGNIISFVGTDGTADLISDGKKLGTAIYSIREDIEDRTKTAEYILLAAYMTALNEKGGEAALEAVVGEMQKLGIVLENSDSYAKIATSDIRKVMAEKLADGYTLGIKRFSSRFGESLITAGVYKAATWRDAMEFLAFSGSEYYEKNPEKAAKAVCGKNYTMSELMDAVKNAVTKKSDSAGGGSSGTSGGSGGGSGTSGGGLFTPTAKPNQSSGENGENRAATVFRDVKDTHWAYDAINFLHWKEIVSGDENGNFNPESNITRAETVKLLCAAFGTEPQTAAAQAFEDTPAEHWAFGYIAAANGAELVNGDENGAFRPDDNISRQELAVMLYRFAVKYGMSFEGAKPNFTDSLEIADYAKAAVGSMAENGIITGNENNAFMPQSFATRAQAAAMVYRIIKNR